MLNWLTPLKTSSHQKKLTELLLIMLSEDCLINITIASPSDTETFWKYLLCGYLSATLHDGTVMTTEPHPKWKLEKAMKTSRTVSEDTPWRTHPDEMCAKTLVKHASKLLPTTDRLSQAVAVLNDHEGIDTDPKPESELEKRLNNSKDITPKVEPEEATGTDSHSGKGTPSAGGEGVKFTQESPPSVNEEKTTISPEEAEAIHQRELKEAGLKPEETKQQTAQNIKDKPYIKPKESGSLF